DLLRQLVNRALQSARFLGCDTRPQRRKLRRRSGRGVLRASRPPRDSQPDRQHKDVSAEACHGVRIYFGKITGNTASVVYTHRSLWPHSETMIALCLAPSVSLTNLGNASPRARLVGPCAIAPHDESNPPSGRVSTCPSK